MHNGTCLSTYAHQNCFARFQISWQRSMVTAVNIRATKYGVDSGSVAYFFAHTHPRLTAIFERATASRIKRCSTLTQTLPQNPSTSSAARRDIADTPGMPDHQSPAGSEDRIHQRQSRSDSRPVEYYIDEKWDKCIDLTLRRVTYSSLAAGVVALVVLSELLP